MLLETLYSSEQEFIKTDIKYLLVGRIVRKPIWHIIEG